MATMKTADGLVPSKQQTGAVNPGNSPTAIDPSVLKFALALVIVGIMVEVVDQFSHTAAWTLVIIIVLGLLLNNPIAIGLISLGGKSLQEGVS